MKQTSDPYLVTQREFAKIIGKSEPWVKTLADRGMPLQRTGKSGPGSVTINSAAAIDWLIEQARQKAAPEGQDEASLRLLTAKADIAEFEANQKRGDMRSLADYQQATSEAAVIFATQMDGLPARMASQLSAMNDAAVIRKALEDETRRIRLAVADRLRDWAMLAEDGGVDNAPSGSDGGPMG